MTASACAACRPGGLLSAAFAEPLHQHRQTVCGSELAIDLEELRRAEERGHVGIEMRERHPGVASAVDLRAQLAIDLGGTRARHHVGLEQREVALAVEQ